MDNGWTVSLRAESRNMFSSPAYDYLYAINLYFISVYLINSPKTAVKHAWGKGKGDELVTV